MLNRFCKIFTIKRKAYKNKNTNFYTICKKIMHKFLKNNLKMWLTIITDIFSRYCNF